MSRKGIGHVFRISMDDGSYCYGTIVDDLVSVIYDLNSKDDISDIKLIIQNDILFAVMLSLPNKEDNNFKIIGKIDLDERHKRRAIFYHVPFADDQALDYHIEKVKQTMVYKTFENGGLQTDGIHRLYHVKERLEDYYSGNLPRASLRDLYMLTVSKILRDEQVSPTDAQAKAKEMFPTLFVNAAIENIPEASKLTTLDDVKKEFAFSTWGPNLPRKQKALAIKSAEKIMNELIGKLKKMKGDVSEPEKLLLFKSAIEQYNVLDSTFEDLIQTSEREQINYLVNKIANLVGINTQNYGDGEGIVSEWRTW